MKPTAMHRAKQSELRQERGIVMIIVLIVLVSMLAAGVAVLRSVDTSNVLSTNLALRQSLVQEGEFMIQYVTDRLSNGTDIPSFGEAIPAQNFHPSRLAENTRGVPLVLAQLNPPSSGPTSYPHERWNPRTQTLTRYVIDVICEGPATQCTASPASKEGTVGGAQRQRPRPAFPGGAYVRATIRVDGPRNTVAYIQTVMR